jgi:phage terminase small subunit
MYKNLFGNNIKPNCAYCKNFDSEMENFCKKGKTIKNDKCRKFDYNPLLRVPKNAPAMMSFSKEDFEL